MTQIIIDGDACPVVSSVIELTQETGIFVTIIRSFSHFSTQIDPEHVRTVYVDDGPESVDYKVVQLASSEDIVITQDYGLASLLLNKVKFVMHHKGFLFNDVISMLKSESKAEDIKALLLLQGKTDNISNINLNYLYNNNNSGGL